MIFFKNSLLLAFLFLNISLSAQTNDLVSLAAGDFLNFNALFDENDNLYGYVAIYGYGKSSEKTKKFEYVILDKNLNAVANQEFEGDITAEGYFGYIDFRKHLILYPRTNLYGVKYKDFFYPRSFEIDMKTNTITQKNYYEFENGIFKEETEPKNIRDANKEDKEEKKEKGFNYISNVYEIKEGGFIVFEYDDYGKYSNQENLMRFDENKNLLWSFKYNEDGNKNKSESIRVIEKDDDYIYTILTQEGGKFKAFYLLVIDMQTGQIVAKNPIEGLLKYTMERITFFYSNYKSIDNDKTFDDKIVIVGRNYESEYQENGFARLVIDKKTFQVDLKILNYENFKRFIPQITEHGMVENGYYLIVRDFFFLENGSVGILMEKYKPQGGYSAPKTTDLVYAYTDENFKVEGIKVFEKEKTKWATNADYLFSQYLNYGKDVVFFYRDLQTDTKTKEKNWNLFINTLINGEFKQEQVQISEKDNYLIIPYVGKEGYILLREYNEKEKFNKIRLERLNY